MNRFLIPKHIFQIFQYPLSLPYLLVWWGGILIGMQQAERWFLLPSVMATEPPTINLIGKTLLLGLLSDSVTAFAGIGLAMILALPGMAFSLFLDGPPGSERWFFAYRRTLRWTFILIGCLFLITSTVDVSYYRMSHHHLNFSFFEYMDDVIQASLDHTESQASNQTRAELSEAGSWLGYLMAFFMLLATTTVMGIWGIHRLWSHSKVPWAHTTPTQFRTVMFAVPFAVGAVAWSPLDLPLAPTLQIDSAAYHGLVQNPILSATLPLRDYIQSHWTWTPATLSQPMNATDALTVTHQILGPSAHWPSLQYPLTREQPANPAFVFPQRVNILLLFVEGLDRRFLGKTIPISNPGQPGMNLPSTIRLTPFLDSLRKDSLYFEHFFSNGVQTTRGLVATLCSVFPRQGTAVIKTRNTHDYLCMPSLLQQAGFNTEMVVGIDSDIPGLRTFLARNGIERITGGRDFPVGVERMGIGVTDGVLFDGLYQRVVELKKQSHPYFLAALTAGTHHPFTVPLRHPEVRALKNQSDPYLASLRNFDLEFSRFFTDLKRNGLLNNTMVIILGDHGRHEPVGDTEGERIAGHFLAPLFIWMDEALRKQVAIVPHTVTTVASQVDLAPTILALNGLTPYIAPFLGRDLSCHIVGSCQSGNIAYLSNMYENAIGIADHRGLWWYAFDTGLLSHTDLDLQSPISHPSLDEPDATQAYRSMIGLYLTVNTLLEHNRIWSWEWASQLAPHRSVSQAGSSASTSEAPHPLDLNDRRRPLIRRK